MDRKKDLQMSAHLRNDEEGVSEKERPRPRLWDVLAAASGRTEEILDLEQLD